MFFHPTTQEKQAHCAHFVGNETRSKLTVIYGAAFPRNCTEISSEVVLDPNFF